jgi:hypothetical protein
MLVNDQGRVKWLRQALIRRDGEDPFEMGMGVAELQEIYNEVPSASEVRRPPPTGVSPYILA